MSSLLPGFAIALYLSVSGEAAQQPLPLHAVEQLEKDLDARFPNNQPGAAIAVISEGEPVIFIRGMANVENQTPVSVSTPFYIASLGKSFTAAAVLMLAEEGRLDLDDSVRRYVSQLPEVYEPVTLRLVLGHQGGVPDYSRLLEDQVPADFMNGDVIRLLETHADLDFAPATDVAYSNSGFVLAAEVVRVASGMGFAVWMDRNIFHPLGMQAFVVEPGTRIPQGVARGYKLYQDGTTSTEDITTRTVGPGSVYASIEDLVKWDQELREGRVLSDSIRGQMRTAIPLAGGRSPFGPGWIAGEIVQGPLQGMQVQQAFGELAGFRAGIRRFHEVGLTVIWLTNRGEHLFDLGLAERMLVETGGQRDY